VRCAESLTSLYACAYLWQRMDLSTFYEKRRRLGERLVARGGNASNAVPALGQGGVGAPPDWLELTLDDNYATRMICGPPAYSSPRPVNASHFACALHNLMHAYSFVGVQERYDESVCVLSRLLGLPPGQVSAFPDAFSPWIRTLCMRPPVNGRAHISSKAGWAATLLGSPPD
jgi:hypothetical protein